MNTKVSNITMMSTRVTMARAMATAMVSSTRRASWTRSRIRSMGMSMAMMGRKRRRRRRRRSMSMAMSMDTAAATATAIRSTLTSLCAYDYICLPRFVWRGTMSKLCLQSSSVLLCNVMYNKENNNKYLLCVDLFLFTLVLLIWALY